MTVSPSLSSILLLLGSLFNSNTLVGLGIIVFAVMVLFSLAILPVEFGASRRALAMLDATGVMIAEERPGACRVLLAAGLTYVASAATSILTVLHYLSIVRDTESSRRSHESEGLPRDSHALGTLCGPYVRAQASDGIGRATPRS